MAENALFLGQQLSEQSAKLGELVTQMTTMINAVNNSIQKFATPSDNVQISKPFNDEVMTINSVGKYITMYVGGEVRIKVTAREQKVNYGKYITLEKNGVTMDSLQVTSTSYDVYMFDIPVDEKDIIKVANKSSYAIEISLIEICYDEVNKPGGVVSD